MMTHDETKHIDTAINLHSSANITFFRHWTAGSL